MKINIDGIYFEGFLLIVFFKKPVIVMVFECRTQSYRYVQQVSRANVVEEISFDAPRLKKEKQEAHGPHRSPEKTVQINENI